MHVVLTIFLCQLEHFLIIEGFHDLEMTFLQLFAYLVHKVYSHCLKLLMKGGCHRGLI